MKISPDGSSFSTGGDVDSLSERSSQHNGVHRAPSQEPLSFQVLSDDRTGKEAELARCFVDIVQANERLAAANERLTAQVYSRQDTVDLTSNETIASITAQMKNLQDSLQMASEERDELKQSAIASQQENSDLVMRLSEECAQLKSELSDVKKDCVSSIARLKEEVALRTTQGPLVQQANQYVWKSSRDVSVSGPSYVERLECPPMTAGIHKWSVLVEDVDDGDDYLELGVASTVHHFEKEKECPGYQEGGWAYHSDGDAYHDSCEVKEDLPTFKKGSKVTFILDLTEEGTLSASVDGKAFHKLFSDMRCIVRSVNLEGGFIPALGLVTCNHKVRFLGFERASA